MTIWNLPLCLVSLLPSPQSYWPSDWSLFCWLWYLRARIHAQSSSFYRPWWMIQTLTDFPLTASQTEASPEKMGLWSAESEIFHGFEGVGMVYVCVGVCVCTCRFAGFKSPFSYEVPTAYYLFNLCTVDCVRSVKVLVKRAWYISQIKQDTKTM